MHKILIFSDSHGKLDYLKQAVSAEKDIEFVICAGDAQGDDDLIREITQCTTYIVCGNCDHFSSLPADFKVEWGEHCIMVTHGHQYFVSLGSRLLKEKARAAGCDIVVFGHTHIPLVEDDGDGVMVLNPGSISLPRQPGKKPSYMVVELDEKGCAAVQIRYL